MYGGDSFSTKKPDPEGLLAILSETETAAPDCWMVGDSLVDMQTAHNALVRACGVNWGFQPESLAGGAPDLLIERPSQLSRLLSDAAIN